MNYFSFALVDDVDESVPQDDSAIVSEEEKQVEVFFILPLCNCYSVTNWQILFQEEDDEYDPEDNRKKKKGKKRKTKSDTKKEKRKKKRRRLDSGEVRASPIFFFLRCQVISEEYKRLRPIL